MKFAAISDVHVKQSGDVGEKILLAFLSHPEVINADTIYLLGDIFDLMIGPHSHYFARFPDFFKKLEELIRIGKKVRYVEGNHDFHLKRLYHSFFRIHKHLDANLFEMAPEFNEVWNGKRIHLSHGDDIELGNHNYKRYKKIVTSPPLTFYANYLMPHFLIKSIGEFSSEKSRKRNIERYSSVVSLEPVRQNFRKSAIKIAEERDFQYVICGHSHVKDLYMDSHRDLVYANNGYAQNSQSFILFDHGTISFPALAL